MLLIRSEQIFPWPLYFWVCSRSLQQSSCSGGLTSIAAPPWSLPVYLVCMSCPLIAWSLPSATWENPKAKAPGSDASHLRSMTPRTSATGNKHFLHGLLLFLCVSFYRGLLLFTTELYTIICKIQMAVGCDKIFVDALYLFFDSSAVLEYVHAV